MKDVKEIAREYWMTKLEMAEPKYCANGSWQNFEAGFLAGYSAAIEQASEGFEEWAEQVLLNDAGNETMKIVSERAWQAGKLSGNKELQLKDSWVKLHQKSVELCLERENKLKAENKCLSHDLGFAQGLLEEKEAENKKLREALELIGIKETK